jgi:hypothetical protein
MLRRTLLVFWPLLILQLLAACGTDAAPVAAPGDRATAAPQPAASAPTAAAATARPPTALPATQPSTAPAAPTAEAAIPEGLTGEGYHMLGRPDAPVTLTMYSDFL